MNSTAKLKLLTEIVAVTEHHNLKEEDFDFLPEGYTLMYTANNVGCMDYDYHALAIYNEEEHEIIISNYGTHLNPGRIGTTFQDIIDDIRLSLGYTPGKFSSAAKFINQTKDLLGDEYNDYKITFVGHSLGGFLAQLGSVQAKSTGFKNVEVVSFDAPGAKEVAVNLAQELKFEGNLNEGIENYVARANMVNTTNTYLGKIFYTPKLSSEAEGEESWYDYFARISGVKSLVTQIDDHMLYNFTEFFNVVKSADLIEVKNWNSSDVEYVCYSDNPDPNQGVISFKDYKDIVDFYLEPLQVLGGSLFTLYDGVDVSS